MSNEEIIVKDGLVLMSEIKVGDKVLSHDGDYHEVEHVWNFEKPTYYVSFQTVIISNVQIHIDSW